MTVVADKGDINYGMAATLWQECRIALLTQRRVNQKQQWPAAVRRVLNQCRQIIETVKGQLDEPFHIEEHHAHSVDGLCARLYTKLTAHTLCVYLNRQVGTPDWLHLKSLALAS
jgi:hypothetical protein